MMALRSLALGLTLLTMTTALVPGAAASPKCEPFCVPALDEVETLADSLAVPGDPGCRPVCLRSDP